MPEDAVGRFVTKGRRSELDRACQRCHRPPRARAGKNEAYEAIPVSFQGRVIAVIARHAAQRDVHRGALEEAYLRSADELIEMIAAGQFPCRKVCRLLMPTPRWGWVDTPR